MYGEYINIKLSHMKSFVLDYFILRHALYMGYINYYYKLLLYRRLVLKSRLIETKKLAQLFVSLLALINGQAWPANTFNLFQECCSRPHLKTFQVR